MFKKEFGVEKYLLMDMPRFFIKALAKFRISSHDLEIEKGRHHKKDREERICTFCKNDNINVIEDEYHVIFDCILYKDIRELYISKEDRSPRNLFTFCNLLSNQSSDCIFKLAKYLYNMFKLRNYTLDVCAT